MLLRFCQVSVRFLVGEPGPGLNSDLGKCRLWLGFFRLHGARAVS
jgi:hypothetical protein